MALCQVQTVLSRVYREIKNRILTCGEYKSETVFLSLLLACIYKMKTSDRNQLFIHILQAARHCFSY